jgi:hypothetical protein
VKIFDLALPRLLSIAVVILGVITSSSAQVRGGGWANLGNSHVDGHNDHDKISVHDHGPFRALRLGTSGGAVKFDHLVVHFQNGESQHVRASFIVRDNSSSPAVDLAGAARKISSVELWYERGNWGSKPRVTLFGRR